MLLLLAMAPTMPSGKVALDVRVTCEGNVPHLTWSKPPAESKTIAVMTDERIVAVVPAAAPFVDAKGAACGDKLDVYALDFVPRAQVRQSRADFLHEIDGHVIAHGDTIAGWNRSTAGTRG